MSIQWFGRTTLDKAITEYIKKADIILDVGSGIRPETYISPKIHICCEPHSEYIHVLETQFSGSTNFVVIQCKAQDIVKVMPNKSVDSIFLIDLIEHLDKEEGKSLISECERIARKQIILFTPLGFMSQEYEITDEDGWGLHGGKWQEHNSGWEPEDFDSSWTILGSHEYHLTNGKGETINPPFGAFWAIKNIKQQDLISLPQKIALISHVFSPNDSGQAIMLSRLLRQIDPEDYCLISNNNFSSIVFPYIFLKDFLTDLWAKYYYLKPEHQITCPNRINFLCTPLNIAFRLVSRALRISKIVRRENCNAIVSCSGDLYNLPAGYLASILCQLPFYAYMFDNYEYQFPQRQYRLFARIAQSIILRWAAGIIVPNESLSDEYNIKYNINAIILHNPIDSSYRLDKIDIPWPTDSREIRIVYTGQVYNAHYDAFRNLIASINQLNRTDLKLHIYTAQPPETLRSEGITGPVVFHNHMPQQYVHEVQQKADILFLPLAFDSPYPEIIKTSAPSKLGEYLSSGRPILAHVPAGSFISLYFREHECGIVIDEKDATILADAIRCIIDDANLRNKLIKNALELAKSDFSIEAAHEKLLDALNPKRRR